MLPDAILFDMDGTFVDTEELHRRAFNRTFAEFGFGWDWTPEIYEQLLNISGGEDRIVYYAHKIAVPAERRERLIKLAPIVHREKTRLFVALADEAHTLARPGVKRLIQEARAAGCRIGVVATSVAPNIRWIMHSALGDDAESLIDAVASATLVRRRKPAPDLYTTVLAMLGAQADRCVAIEDSANGVAAAKAAGLVTIAVPGRWTKAQDFSRADLVLPSLGDPEAPLSAAAAAELQGAPFLKITHIEMLMQSQYGSRLVH